MLALAERFGFRFEANTVGDANRSARVERPFHFIENNFYAGREFSSIDDLNAKLRQWCDRVNDRSKRSLSKTPFELLAVERPALKPLPAFIPEVYELHTRRVDTEGYVSLHRNRYSMPTAMIGRTVELRESMTRVRAFDGHRLVVTHERSTPGAKARHTLLEHVRDGRHCLRVGPRRRSSCARSRRCAASSSTDCASATEARLCARSDGCAGCASSTRPTSSSPRSRTRCASTCTTSSPTTLRELDAVTTSPVGDSRRGFCVSAVSAGRAVCVSWRTQSWISSGSFLASRSGSLLASGEGLAP